MVARSFLRSVGASGDSASRRVISRKKCPVSCRKVDRSARSVSVIFIQALVSSMVM